uniref:Ricin B lectin n=1 Tax=Phaselicystis flava TaxID=525924 RepID=A0A3S5GYI5_9BACT|nr:ricin B lectin [Phaselicystis flava]
MGIWDDFVDFGEETANTVSGGVTSAFNDVANGVTSAASAVESWGAGAVSTAGNGIVEAYQQTEGAVIYAVSWSQGSAGTVQSWTSQATGQVVGFGIDAYNHVKPWAMEAWRLLSGYLRSAPPRLGPHDDTARDFIHAVLAAFMGGQLGLAESVVKSWESDARSKGYTMAIDFRGTITFASFAVSGVTGVYVDKGGRWGFFADFGVGAEIIPSSTASVNMDLWMIFGGVSAYAKTYYKAGGEIWIQGFVVGGDVLLTSGFDFAGFRAAIGVGVDWAIFGSPDVRPTPHTGPSGVAPSLPSLDVYSVSLVPEQATTYTAACQVARNPPAESSVLASAFAAATGRSPTLFATAQYGGSGGDAFADEVGSVARITGLTLLYTEHVNQITTTYLRHDGSSRSAVHGTAVAGSRSVTIALEPGEWITEITGRCGKLLDRISITTNLRTFGPFGGADGSEFAIRSLPMQPIVGLFGRSGQKIDAIGAFYQTGLACTLTAQHSEMCLAPAGEAMGGEAVLPPTAEGAKAAQMRWNGSESRQWTLVPVAKGAYYVVQKSSGLHLTGGAKGASPELRPLDGSPAQQWSLMTVAGAPGHYALRNMQSGLVLGVAGAATGEGAAIVLEERQRTAEQPFVPSQQWKIDGVPARVYLYTEGGFSGRFQTLAPGAHDIGSLRVGNDRVASVRVPAGFRVTLFRDAGFSGPTSILTGDAASLGSMSGQTSSVRVEMPPWGVTAFTATGYGGASQTFVPGKYDRPGLLVGDNTLGSAKIPAGWRLTLFDGEGFRGQMAWYTSADGSALEVPDLGPIRGKTSSLVVEAAPLGQASVFTGTSFQGSAQGFGPGRYNMSAIALGNDRIRSVKVPPGWTVVLYEHKDFEGATKTLTSSVYDLKDWKDKASSLVVIPG